MHPRAGGPGDDRFATGKCSGLAQPDWLKVWDVVRVEVEGIGALENRVVADSGETFIAPLALMSEEMTTIR